MARTEIVTITNMCMIYDDDKVIVQDKIDDSWKGITFPGGHVEKGESFTDALIREVFEETGLTVSCPQLCGIKDWSNDDGSRYMVLLYKTDKFTGEIRGSDEGDVYWVNKDELFNMTTSNDMNAMLKVFFNDNISEFHYYQDNGKWEYVLK